MKIENVTCTVDKQINYAKALWNQVFDITSADTAKDGAFIFVLTATPDYTQHRRSRYRHAPRL